MKQSSYLSFEDIEKYKLDDLSMFKNVDQQHFEKLLSVCKIKKYEVGELIITEGKRDSWFYILLTGKVSVSVRTTELTVLFNRGDIFGEGALFNKNLRGATLTTLESCQCLALDVVLLEEIHSFGDNRFFAYFYKFLAEVLYKRVLATGEELSLVKEVFKYTNLKSD